MYGVLLSLLLQELDGAHAACAEGDLLLQEAEARLAAAQTAAAANQDQALQVSHYLLSPWTAACCCRMHTAAPSVASCLALHALETAPFSSTSMAGLDGTFSLHSNRIPP